MYFFYSAVMGLALLLSSPWWLLQMVRHGKYRAGLWERLGRVPQRIRLPHRPAIWVHAVSVGEVLAIAEAVRKLGEEFRDHRILISTTTQSGQELARKRFGDANVTYFPLDFAFCIGPYLNAVRPDLVILAETEFWPNFLRTAKAAGARVAVVNARISDRSFPRYRRCRRLLGHVLSKIDIFCAQTEEDARRLREIGAPSGHVEVSGNVKFDVHLPAETPLVTSLRGASESGGARPIIVCGSTVDGEEERLLRDFADIIRPRLPHALLILAPRHPERFEQVLSMIGAFRLPVIRRSNWNNSAISGGVFLLDSIGELAAVYAIADVAIVGGGFAPRGGHNVLEPAWFSKPVIIGPHYHNFRDVVEQFRHAEAITITQEPLKAALALLENSERLGNLGLRARAVLDANAGATERTLSRLRPLLENTRSEAAIREVAL